MSSHENVGVRAQRANFSASQLINDRITSIHEQIKGLNHQITGLAEQIAWLSRELAQTAATKPVEPNRSQFETADGFDSAGYAAAMSKYRSDLSAWQNKMNSLQGKINDCNRDIDRVQGEIEDLNRKVQSLNAELSDVQRKELEEAKKAMEDRFNALPRQVEDQAAEERRRLDTRQANDRLQLRAMVRTANEVVEQDRGFQAAIRAFSLFLAPMGGAGIASSGLRPESRYTGAIPTGSLILPVNEPSGS